MNFLCSCNRLACLYQWNAEPRIIHSLSRLLFPHFDRPPPPPCSQRHSSTRGTRTLYDDLELNSDATSEEIKAAYFRLSKEHHPDKSKDDPAAIKKFQSVTEAYGTLGSAKLRRMYDKGTLGFAISVADRDAVAHKFDGDAFYAGRDRLRREFGAAGFSKNDMDHYVNEQRAQTFRRRLVQPSKPSRSNRVDDRSSGSGGLAFRTSSDAHRHAASAPSFGPALALLVGGGLALVVGYTVTGH